MYDLQSATAAISQERDFLSSGSDGLEGDAAPEQRGGRTVEGAPRRILIVEDETFAILYMADILTESEFDVVGTASSADEAVAKAAGERPDLVLMDVRLTGLRDGIYAAREIMERFAIRSLFVSAYSDPQTRHRADVAKPTGFVEKPFTPEGLLAAVRASF